MKDFIENYFWYLYGVSVLINSGMIYWLFIQDQLKKDEIVIRMGDLWYVLLFLLAVFCPIIDMVIAACIVIGFVCIWWDGVKLKDRVILRYRRKVNGNISSKLE